MKSIVNIDRDLGSILINDFLKLIKFKHEFLKENQGYLCNPQNDLGDRVLYNNTRIDELGLLFNFPGYSDLELIDNGLETLLTVHNIEEYTIAIFDKLFGNGIKLIIDAFKNGFEIVFSISNLKSFTSAEIQETLCGSLEEKWDYDVLLENVKPDHGYSRESLIYQYLLKYMTEIDKMTKKKFLIFVSGSPRLPVGGFKNLTPKLTVVKKTLNNCYENPNDFLPTVMTCQTYLKIPEYTSYEIFLERITTAINEGSNAFLLS